MQEFAEYYHQERMESYASQQMPSEEAFIKLGKELQSHRLSYIVENDDGDGLPLVDILTPDGDKDISRGLQEIEYIVDAVYDWLKSLQQENQTED